MTDTTGTPIGSVISLTGSAWAVSGTTQRALEQGAPVYEGEEIVTEKDSNVEIKLADDTILGQGEDSAIRLDEYIYSGDDGSLDFHMVKGVMRVVSGEIVKLNPEGFNLTTPLATIGIRGTEVMVQVDQGREIIGVDKLGAGHTVLISNAFNEIVIDKAGMFSGVDFDAVSSYLMKCRKTSLRPLSEPLRSPCWATRPDPLVTRKMFPCRKTLKPLTTRPENLSPVSMRNLPKKKGTRNTN